MLAVSLDRLSRQALDTLSAKALSASPGLVEADSSQLSSSATAAQTQAEDAARSKAAGLSAADLSSTLSPELKALLDFIARVKEQAKASQAEASVISTLKTSALQQSEALVKRDYGLLGDGATLKVQLDSDMGNALASVSYRYDASGKMADETLHLNKRQFLPDASANGTNGHVIQNDRIVAHEITHAVMGRNMDWAEVPTWFREGSAEYLAGGAERAHLALDGMSASELGVLAAEAWTGTSEQYAGAYLAVRYLDATTQTGGGLKAIMARLKAGDDLDAAITKVSGGTYAGASGFLDAWQAQAASFVDSIDLSGRTPGAIGGATSGAQVVSDAKRNSNQPMAGFRVIWPGAGSGWAYALSAYRQAEGSPGEGASQAGGLSITA